MTYLQLINSVLRRLREDEVSTPTETDYSTLIGDFVNATKREVEDAWKWTTLRSTKTVTTVAGTVTYVVTDANNRAQPFSPTNSVWNDTEEYWLKPNTELAFARDTWVNDATADRDQPTTYRFRDGTGAGSGGDLVIALQPPPDAVYTIYCSLITPQDDLSAGTDVLWTPEWPVVLGTYAKALAERGEDSGRTHGEVLSQYQLALGDAIAIDNTRVVGEMTWMVE